MMPNSREAIVANIEYFRAVKEKFLAQAKAAEELEIDYQNRLLDLDRQDQI
jgi:hypothetical protein